MTMKGITITLAGTLAGLGLTAIGAVAGRFLARPSPCTPFEMADYQAFQRRFRDNDIRLVGNSKGDTLEAGRVATLTRADTLIAPADSNSAAAFNAAMARDHLKADPTWNPKTGWDYEHK